MKPFTSCSIAAIFQSHFWLINKLPLYIFANHCSYHLQNINIIARYLTWTTKVGSLQCYFIKRLQHTWNATACLITLTRKHGHITHSFKSSCASRNSLLNIYDFSWCGCTCTMCPHPTLLQINHIYHSVIFCMLHVNITCNTCHILVLELAKTHMVFYCCLCNRNLSFLAGNC